ncbi:MAG TPA: transglutaminaseTgpA domain-containing protein [Planctomycetota bacterium]|nr:transglutaminaseTgpA domain-containing protein [Planctomycetota bacterium]
MSRWARVAFAAASVAAFGVAVGAWIVLPGIAALLVVERLRPVRTSSKVHRWALGIGGTVMVGVAILPLLVTFQQLYAETALRVALPIGVLLSVLLAGFLWAAPELVLPGSIALLTAAALGRESLWLYLLVGSAGVSAVLHLAGDRPIRLVPLVVFLVGSTTTAVGVCRFLPWAQPWVEGKAGDLLASAKTARAGLSLTSRLGEIEELGLSPDVALRVWSDRPQYLRGRVYRVFNGRVWSRGAETVRRTLTPAPALDPDLERWLHEVPGVTWSAPAAGAAGPQIRSRILLERRPPAGALLAPGGVDVVRLNGNAATMDGSGVLEPWGTSPELYAVVNRPSMPAPAAEPDCLDASGETDLRMNHLAARLRQGADPAERVRRTLAYLESTCTYSLHVGQFLSQDPVGEFVFDKRKGYCEYFASAATLLLRMEGVPARYVVGYCVRPENREGGHYVVREADAHAWVEAWLEGRGWVELDPTPAAQFESLRASLRGGVVAGLWERMKAWFGVIRIAGLRSAWRTVGLLVGGAIGAVLAVLLLARGRGRWRIGPKRTRVPATGDAAVPPGVRELLGRLDRVWKRSGHPRPASRAPLEHWRALPESARSGREIVDAIYRCRYGGWTPSPEELAVLRRGLAD